MPNEDFEEIGEDFEDIAPDSTVTSGKDKPDSFFDIIGGVAKKVPWKVAIFIFLIFMFVSSDLFIEWILSRVKGATLNAEATPLGTFIQGLVVILGFVAVNALVEGGLI